MSSGVTPIDPAFLEQVLELPHDGKLSEPAINIIRKRYSLRTRVHRDNEGNIANEPESHFGIFTDQVGDEWFSLESFRDTCARVAWAVAQAEPEHKRSEMAWKFFLALYDCLFVPNSPTWWGAGQPHGQLSACFVVGPEGVCPSDPDSLEAIYALKRAAGFITHSGGGIGIHIGAFRPKGSPVKNGAHGTACGPVKVLADISHDLHGLTQRGKREAAGMCIMPVWHPDVIEFIRSKTQEGQVHNFNISVAVTDEFMEAVEANATFALHHPKWVATLEHFPLDARAHVELDEDDEHVAYIDAKWLFDQMVQGAHKNGEPGLFFIDRAGQEAWAEHGIDLRGTNPCGEQPLPDYGVCNLGHVNLATCVSIDGAGHPYVDWDKLRSLTWLGVRFLDDVIDVNSYPLPEITTLAQKYRNIGTGILGYADMLLQLGIPYGSERAIELAEEIEEFRYAEALRASKKLALERGSNFHGDRRNLILLTVAPTGTTGQVAGVEGSGIEPVFNPGYWRKDHVHPEGIFVGSKYRDNPAFRCAVSKWETSPGTFEYRPEFEVTPEQHVRTQAAFQKWNDSGISKTINLPNHATEETVRETYMLAWQLGCKGITVYRDGSRQVEVLSTTKKEGKFDPQAALKEKQPGEFAMNDKGQPVGVVVFPEMPPFNSLEPEPKVVYVREPIEEVQDDARARRFRVKYKGKKVYVFVGENEKGEPRELFVKTPGLFDQELPSLDALCRMTSVALRAGVPLPKVIEQLEESKGTISQDNHANVLLAALHPYTVKDNASFTIRLDLTDCTPEEMAEAINEVVDTVTDGCPSCGARIAYQAGCLGCSANCGYSKCG